MNRAEAVKTLNSAAARIMGSSGLDYKEAFGFALKQHPEAAKAYLEAAPAANEYAYSETRERDARTKIDQWCRIRVAEGKATTYDEAMGQAREIEPELYRAYLTGRV